MLGNPEKTVGLRTMRPIPPKKGEKRRMEKKGYAVHKGYLSSEAKYA